MNLNRSLQAGALAAAIAVSGCNRDKEEEYIIPCPDSGCDIQVTPTHGYDSYRLHQPCFPEINRACDLYTDVNSGVDLVWHENVLDYCWNNRHQVISCLADDYSPEVFHASDSCNNIVENTWSEVNSLFYNYPRRTTCIPGSTIDVQCFYLPGNQCY